MSSTTTQAPLFANPGLAVATYLSAAVALFIILGITFCLLRRLRLRRAKKYIKAQSNLSIAMGPVLTSAPPTAPWKWKEVKANIKARRRGEERPYSGYGREPSISVITENDGEVNTSGRSTPTTNGLDVLIGSQTSNGASRPNSASVINRPQSAGNTTSLGPSHSKMHGVPAKSQAAHHVKHERLQKRIQAKKERRAMKERQKEIKRDLTNILEGQRLPGDEFPETKSVTHVGPLRRESVSEIPNQTYLIEQSPRDKNVHRSKGANRLVIPQNLSTWAEEEANVSSSNLSAKGRVGGSPRRVLGEVTVHEVSDSRPIPDIDDDTTEL